jgi:hypothetical protein
VYEWLTGHSLLPSVDPRSEVFTDGNVDHRTALLLPSTCFAASAMQTAGQDGVETMSQPGKIF